MKRRLYRALVDLGRVARLHRLIDPNRAGLLRVLMYHRVTSEPAPLAVTAASFERQQQLLAERYRVVSLDDVLAHAGGQRQLPARAVLITFDDAYRDNLTLAKPILDCYEHPATLFVPTDFIETGASLPHDRLAGRISETLSWDELRTLSASFAIESHGCSHRVMTQLSPGDVDRELRESKELIESKLGRPVRALSYPKGSIGDFDATTQRAAQQAGYELVFTTLPGVNRPSFDPLRIRRHNVEDFGIDYFEALLDGTAALLAVKDSRAGYEAKRAINGRRGRY